MILVGYGAARNFVTTIADVWSLIQPVTMLPNKILTGTITGRARSTLNPTKDYLVTGICLVTTESFFTVVLFVIKRSSAVPLV
jgi:hypothetical protein